MVEINDVEFDDECPNGCGRTLREDKLTETFPRPDGSHMLVRDLPVLRCSDCDDYFIPMSSHEKLRELAEKQPEETVEIPAFTLKEAS